MGWMAGKRTLEVQMYYKEARARPRSKLPMLLPAQDAGAASASSSKAASNMCTAAITCYLVLSSICKYSTAVFQMPRCIHLALGKLALPYYHHQRHPQYARLNSATSTCPSPLFTCLLMMLLGAVGCGYCLWLQQCGSERAGHSCSRQGAAAESAGGAAESGMRHVWLH